MRSPFKKSAMKGSSSKGKEPVIDLDSLTPKSKKTQSSTGFYDADNSNHMPHLKLMRTSYSMTKMGRWFMKGGV